ncbi:MAG: V-type ATP synthase subunit D [Clostridia bacterium]|nr:V-type ATP synthase subunit D [Clostridia bacterium]
MPTVNVNPTRMELKKLKIKFATSRRGHKLLKDKRDELMKKFLEIVKQNKALRIKVEDGLREYYKAFGTAGATSSRMIIGEALIAPTGRAAVDVDLTSVMSVTVPTFRGEGIEVGINYGMAFTPPELDSALEALSVLSKDMLKLAELEKTAQLLSVEIERTRRRVNALEFILMPRYLDQIKRISMKLDEDERGNTARLMKVKEMMVESQRAEKRADMFGADDSDGSDYDLYEVPDTGETV